MKEDKENNRSDALKSKFEELFKDNYSRLYYYALHFIQDSEVCKDLVSDTFHFIWENIDSLRMETAKVYIFTHLQRLCLDYLRHSGMMVAKTDSYLAMLKEWNGNDWRESEARIQKIMCLINDMPPLTRTVMEQCYIHKKKYIEVAGITGLSESGVRKHVMKGLNIIREYFSVKYKKRY
ncbi:sigma-70 family RNA polymerase sigma factor [Bacteroides sp. AN502(2024)]|uniref:sigma-70 family RNA polymerase sigma factor n=1 Tax=Bacteroides sp. AN502(2024) TaxID=3160599 RepID=UPI0035141A31